MPRPTSVPAAGDWLKVIALVAVQVSMTLTLSISLEMALWYFSLALAPGTAKQITVGAVLSVTVKVVVQVALLPASSVAVKIGRAARRQTSDIAVGDVPREIELVSAQFPLALTRPNTLGTASSQTP